MPKVARFALRYLTAAFCCQYLFLVGWLKPRHRALIRTINEHFGFGDRRTRPLLPLVQASELFDLDGPLELHEAVGADGNVSLLELAILSRSVVHSRPRLLFEIGTFDGRTTLNLAANAPAGAKVLTLDLPASDAPQLAVAEGDRRYIDKPVSGARFLGTTMGSRITQLFGDSAKFDFTPYAGQVEWMFIDGAHSADYVRNDSRVALEILAPAGGWIFWHDYGAWEGVTEALNGLMHDPRFAGLRHIQGTTLAVLRVTPRQS